MYNAVNAATGVLYGLNFCEKMLNYEGTIINTCASASNLQPARASREGRIMAFLNQRIVQGKGIF